MSEYAENGMQSVFPFIGLVPSRATQPGAARIQARIDSRRDSVWQPITMGLAATMPIVLVSTLAMTVLNPTSPKLAPKLTDTNATGLLTLNGVQVSPVSDEVPANDIHAAAADVPTTYVVKTGDTVTSIAEHFRISLGSVLALNGLSWSSVVFPNQVLRLTKSAIAASAVPAESTDVASLAVTPVATTTATPTAPATTPVAAAAPAAPAVTTQPKAAASVSFTYSIVSGDTISAIAGRFGVSVQAILAANGLTSASIIYAGRKLVIPGVTGRAATAPSSSGSASATTPTATTVVPLTASMAANARVIIAVGRSENVPSFGIVIALATAAQESRVENLSYGDADSVGLFQQRPSAGWGTVAQLENPTYASQLFYGGPSNPNKGRTRGLLDIPGWQSMSLTQAAQAVQDSAYPSAYAKWETSARAWFAQLG
jgi:N-acetylmuramoyl-L-alanine amidase